MPADPAPVASPTDPRIAAVGRESVAGEDQIDQMLAASPAERLRCLVDMIQFEDRAHRAKPLSRAR